ncbi:4107_t:CDS:2 [Racocetra fulgida]|uniref:4107_t:CDS:1 n=1 Tax=Racocetra fulgida TaxID=60492 RepID=A0A9N9JM75_9GLOM|nr:4107_t:CDS:2 [Racocetra fulgida]
MEDETLGQLLPSFDEILFFMVHLMVDYQEQPSINLAPQALWLVKDSTKNSPIQFVILQVKQKIYNSLQKYWGNLNNAGLLAILLDSRLKKICPWPNYIREKTIRLYREELDTIANDRPLPTASPQATTSSTNRYFTSIFYDYSNDDSTDNELDKYMDIKIVSIAPQDKSPLEW